MSTTYIMTDNVDYAAFEARNRGLDIESRDTVVVRSCRQVEGIRIVAGDQIIDAGQRLTFNWLSERERIWEALKRTVMMTGAWLMTDPDDPRLTHVVPTKKKDSE